MCNALFISLFSYCNFIQNILILSLFLSDSIYLEEKWGGPDSNFVIITKGLKICIKIQRENLYSICKQCASCGPHCPRSNYMERGASNGSSRSSRKPVRRRWREGFAISKERDEMKEFHRERQGERNYVAEKRRK